MFVLLPGCICSAEGTVNGGQCEDSTGLCQCKANVEGPRCDRCKRGYYGLSASNPLGCSSESLNPYTSLFVTHHSSFSVPSVTSDHWTIPSYCMFLIIKYIKTSQILYIGSLYTYSYAVSDQSAQFLTLILLLLSRVFLLTRRVTVRCLWPGHRPVSLSSPLPRPDL